MTLNCNVEDPSPEQLEFAAKQAIEIREWASTRATCIPSLVPLNIVCVRQDNGSFISNYSITQSVIDNSISVLNSLYAPVNITFYQVGRTHFVNSTSLNNPAIIPGQFGTVPIRNGNTIGYYFNVPNAINIAIMEDGTDLSGFGTQPSETIDDPMNVSPFDNIIGLHPSFFIEDIRGGIGHEMGHIFNLIHTHSITEYVTRDPLFRNCYDKGDLCCDTQASCAPFSTSNAYVNCDYNSGTCQTRPSFNNRDLLGALKTPDINNVMSYFFNCRTDLSQEQYDRVCNSRFLHRDELDENLIVSLDDFIEFEGTSSPVKNTRIVFTSSTNENLFKSISDYQGNFQGFNLPSTPIKAEVKKLGSSFVISDVAPYSPLAQNNQGPIDNLTPPDWVRCVTASDIHFLTQGILGNTSLLVGGYKKLAADANNSGQVTMADVVAINRLILGVESSFPNHSQPWQFIPEFIPQDYPTDFNLNPFVMNINGNTVTDDFYTSPNFEFSIPNGLGGKAGFDGVKIGDVNGSCALPTNQITSNDIELTEGETPFFEDGKNYEIKLYADNFESVKAWQIALDIDKRLEVLETKQWVLNTFSETESAHYHKGVLKALWWEENALDANQSREDLHLFSIIVKYNPNNTSSAEFIQLDKSFENAFYEGNGSTKSMVFTTEILPYEAPTGNRTWENTTQLKLTIQPNPVYSNFSVNIQSNYDAQGELSIVDIFGNVLFTQKQSIFEGNNLLDLSKVQIKDKGTFQVIWKDSMGAQSTSFSKL